MSRQIETSMTTHTATEYWGGDHRGVCIQITVSDDAPRPKHPHDREGFIQLDLEEAVELCNTLAAYIAEECKRRQSLLSKQIEEMRLAEKTIFHEAAAIAPEVFNVRNFAVSVISRLAPKV